MGGLMFLRCVVAGLWFVERRVRRVPANACGAWCVCVPCAYTDRPEEVTVSEDERITWGKEWRAAREAALEMWVWHVVNDEAMDGFDASHEYADSHECVIYYHKARALFDDSSEVRDYEDEASVCLDSEASIGERIARCVYIALQRAFDEAADELDELDVPDEDELDDETLEAWAWRAGREALGMETKA